MKRDMHALGRFQTAVAQALDPPGARAPGTFDEPAIAALVAQPGFAVYRNTVAKGRIDALQANFPSVARLVGDEWFRAAAAIFARTHPPRDPVLLRYGEAFPDFLAAFPPAAELPYLAPVATLDRWWTEAHCAADEAVLDPGAAAAAARGDLGECRLVPGASTRWGWFDDQPIATLWARNRYAEGAVDLSDIEWRGEGLLIVRPGPDVIAVPLDRGTCAFLDACAGGASLADAATRVLARVPQAELADVVGPLLEAGAFSGMAMPHIKGDNDADD